MKSRNISQFLCLVIILNVQAVMPATEISEKTLLQMMMHPSEARQGSSLDLWQNEVTYYNTLTQVYSNKLIFAPELYSTISYIETKEKPLISFQPVFSPSRYFELGIKQLLPFGVSWNFYGSTLLQDAEGNNAASSFKHASTTVVGLNLEIDLWSDFLGRGTGNLFTEAKLQEEQSRLEKSNIDQSVVIEIRQLYWSLVATNESIELMDSLIVIAKKQLEESQKRRKNSLADSDEVSRYEAQYLGRISELNFKQFKKEKMLQEIKRRVSLLQENEIQFKKEDINQTQLDVMTCIRTISQINEIPFDATNLDEQMKILTQLQQLQKSRYSRDNNIHLKLFGGVRSTGVDSNLIATNQYQGSQSESWNDLYNNDRWGTEVGIKFNMPLGSSSSKLQESQSRLAFLSKELHVKEIEESLRLHHQQFKRMIKLLEAGVTSQAAQSKSLKNVITSMQQKYRQARISLNDLLQNQDAHYEAELRTIDARLEILMYLLDYLKLFPKTDCEFNRF